MLVLFKVISGPVRFKVKLAGADALFPRMSKHRTFHLYNPKTKEMLENVFVALFVGIVFVING